MKTIDELRAANVMLDGVIHDYAEWDKVSLRHVGYGGYATRPGATKTGIINSITMIRRMLLQIEKEVEKA